MTEETVFEVEKKMSKNEIAKYLKNVAEKMEAGEQIKLESQGNMVDIETDRDAEFEVKVERDVEKGEESLELEIEWKSGASELNIS